MSMYVYSHVLLYSQKCQCYIGRAVRMSNNEYCHLLLYSDGRGEFIVTDV